MAEFINTSDKDLDDLVSLEIGDKLSQLSKLRSSDKEFTEKINEVLRFSLEEELLCTKFYMEEIGQDVLFQRILSVPGQHPRYTEFMIRNNVDTDSYAEVGRFSTKVLAKIISAHKYDSWVREANYLRKGRLIYKLGNLETLCRIKYSTETIFESILN